MQETKPFKLDLLLLKSGVDTLNALDNRTRQALLTIIQRHQPIHVKSLYKKLQMEQAAVSAHLRVLRRAGFVKGQREGKKIYYSLNLERFEQIEYLLKEMQHDPLPVQAAQ